MSGAPSKLVTLGRVAGVYGVQGWLKIHSHTEPRENIIAFERWVLRLHDEEREVLVEDGRLQGKNVIAKLAEVDDRDQARALIGAAIAVHRDALPTLEAGEFYWADLKGLEVRTLAGQSMGRVDHLLETGAHDVLVIESDPQRLIPFVLDKTVREVDLEAGVIVVDWDPEY